MSKKDLLYMVVPVVLILVGVGLLIWSEHYSDGAELNALAKYDAQGRLK